MPPPQIICNGSSPIPIRTLYRRPSQCQFSLKSSNDHKHMARYRRIRINVSGQVHETYRCILENFPDTLLGDPKRRTKYWDDERKEFFFDAHPRCFEAIFQFYQTGYLRRPLEVPVQTFLEQLQLFQLDKETLKQFRSQEGIMEDEEDVPPVKSFKEHIWNIFEYPRYSRSAHVISILSLLVIVISVMLLCVETMPNLHVSACRKLQKILLTGHIDTKKVPNFTNEFFLLETCCIAWFTFEFIVRMSACPSLKVFCRDPANILDIFAIVPYYVFLLILTLTQECEYARKGGALIVLRILRILRIFKLTRHNRSLKLLRLAFQDSIYELVACFFLITLTALIFAGIIYWVEIELIHSHFRSIEEALWWAFATMTTVGYGDVVPQTRQGKAVATVCIIIGTIVLALPAPIIVTNFNRYYRNETGRGLPEEDMRKRK